MENNLVIIGKIHTPFHTISECPRNIDKSQAECIIEVNEKYKNAIGSLEKGQEIVILYFLNGGNYDREDANNFDNLFCMRTPIRPNPIGLAVLPIEKIEGNNIYVNGLDCLCDTPLLDIKPAIIREKQM